MLESSVRSEDVMAERIANAVQEGAHCAASAHLERPLQNRSDMNALASHPPSLEDSPSMKKPKRRRYIVIAAFGVVAVTLMYCASGSDREVASIDGFWALDEGGAVIVWRATHQSRRATGSVTRLDASGKEIWTMPLPEASMAQ